MTTTPQAEAEAEAEFSWTIPSHRQDRIDGILRAVANMAAELAELANADGTIGDEASQEFVSQVFALSLDEAQPLTSLLDNTPTSVEIDYANADDDFDPLLALTRKHNIAVQLVSPEGPGGGWPTVRLIGKRRSVRAAIAEGWGTDAVESLTEDGHL